MKKLLCLLLTLCLLTPCAAGLGERHFEGSPWINPELPGNVPESRPALEDHYYLHVMHEKCRQPIPETQNGVYTSLTPLKGVLQERIWSLVESGGSTEAQILRIVTDRIQDGAKRQSDGAEPLMARIRRVQAVQSLSELSALSRESGFLIGSPYAALQLESALDESGRFALTLIPVDIVPTLEPDWETFESEAELKPDTGKVEQELLLAGYSAEDAKALSLRLADFQKAAQDPGPQESEGEEPPFEQIVSGDTVQSLCIPLYDQLVSLGLMSASGESRGLIQLRNIPGFIGLQKQYTEENLDLFKAILCLSMVRYAAPYLKPAPADESTGPASAPDLKAEAFSYLQERARLVTEQAYADAYLSPELRRAVQELFHECRETLVQIFRENTWLTEEARNRAVEKASSVRMLLVGSEEHIDFEPLLNAIRDEHLSLLDTAIQVELSELQVLLRLSGTPFDRSHRLLNTASMIEPDAVYEPSRNAIYVMAGVLFGDFCKTDTREAFLATIGQTIAHEIGHGFDPNGIQHDATGNAPGILTSAEDLEGYQERVMRHVRALSQIALSDDLMQSGERVIPEALADLLGMRIVLRIAEKTEGFDYDLFFRSLAGKFYQAFATREAAYSLYESDTHPAPFIRLNYILPQFNAFYLTYPSVQEGTPMLIAPENRELIW